MGEHKWWEASGTTMECERCGWIRYSENRRGDPVPNFKAEVYKYAPNASRWGKAKTKKPECVPNRSDK